MQEKGNIKRKGYDVPFGVPWIEYQFLKSAYITQFKEPK